MKKVKTKTFIPRQLEQREGSSFKTVVEGTGKFSDDFTEKGFFHVWGLDNDMDGEGSFTVAIIERLDGKVEQVLPRNVKFVSG